MQIGLFEDKRRENFNLKTQIVYQSMAKKKWETLSKIERKNTEEIQREREKIDVYGTETETTQKN